MGDRGGLAGPPEALVASGFLARVGGEVVAPSAPTCGKRTLDYFLVSAKLSHIVVGTQIVEESGTKPHSAVRLVIASGGRDTCCNVSDGHRIHPLPPPIIA